MNSLLYVVPESEKDRAPLSPFQPSQEVKELYKKISGDLTSADNTMKRPFREFGDMTIIDRANLDQKDWLGWSDAPSADPDEAWMFRGTSMATRAKIISTAAHLTQTIIHPAIYAQNEEQEEDDAASYVMREVLEWVERRQYYEETFLFAVISGLVNPVSYYQTEYCESYQSILQGTSSEYTRQQVVDDVFSGFQDNLLPLDEVLIGNPYCYDIQKQPCVFKRRRTSYTELSALYGEHPNFAHVRPGVISTLGTDNLFYDVQDTYQDMLVEELTPMYRTKDFQCCIVNGIYLSNDNVEYNPMKHRTNKNKPKYPIVKYGAEPIDAKRFWAYKSLAAKLSNDKELADRMRQNAVDASTFATFPSSFTMGAGKIDRSAFIPATLTEIGRDAKVQPATGFANPTYAWTAAHEAEKSMNESSLDPQLAGISGSQKTAHEAELLQRNAIENMGVMGRMMAQMVKQVGELKIDNIARYVTVGEVEQLVGGALGMKYQTLVLNDKIKDGKKKNVIIRFTDALAYAMSDEEKKLRSVELYEEAGDKKEIHEVNPSVFSSLEYRIEIEPDAMKPKNEYFDRALKLEIFDRAIDKVPPGSEEYWNIMRDFLFFPGVGSDAGKYIPKNMETILPELSPPAKGLPGRTVEAGALQGITMK